MIGRMNPTLRGFLLIVAVCVAIVGLSLEGALVSLWLLARIAFFLALAFVGYRWWREHRGEISEWSGRLRAVFYVAAALVVVDFAVFFVLSPDGPDALAFFLVLGGCGYAMWRAWREAHSYS